MGVFVTIKQVISKWWDYGLLRVLSSDQKFLILVLTNKTTNNLCTQHPSISNK